MIVSSKSGKYLVLLAITALLLLSLPSDNLWLRELFNAGHTVLFFIISFVLYSLLHDSQRFSDIKIVYLLVLLIGLLFGVTIEMLQGFLQRESSIDDIYRDFLGLMSGISALVLSRLASMPDKIMLAVLSSGLLFVGMFSFLQISLHYVQRSDAFPLIIEFEKKWATSFMRFNNAVLLVDANAEGSKPKMFRVRFDAGSYPGISIIEPEENWLSFNTLRFNVFSNNAADVELTLRIHDKEHNQNYDDRFNRSFNIQPGLNEIVVNLNEVQSGPAGRKLDMENIAGITLFMVDLDSSLLLGVSNIFLTN